jgi:putative oxidoreductase
MNPGSSAGRRMLPCTATTSDPQSWATSQQSMGRSSSQMALILTPGSFTTPLWRPGRLGALIRAARFAGPARRFAGPARRFAGPARRFAGPARRLQGGLAGQRPFMPVLRAVARPMVASIFIIQGFDTFRRPERVAAAAEPVVRPVAERVPVVPAKAEQAVRLNGAVQMVAGSMLALGRWPRLSALAIATSLVPTTLAGHRFWEAEDEASKAQQRIHFLKNLSMFGGLLIAVADTAGKPSVAWRARHALKSARRPAGRPARSAQAVRSAGSAQAAQAARSARSARREASRIVRSARREASRMTRTARREAWLAARTAKARVGAARVSGKAGARAARTAGKAGARAARTAGKAGARAGRLAGRASR